MSKRNLFGKRQAPKRAAPDVASSDDSEDESKMVEQVVEDSEENSSDDEIMEGDFVVVSINSAKGISQRYIARIDIVNDNEQEEVFMKKMTGHRLEEEKPAFIIDHKNEASFHKQDILKALPAPANQRGSYVNQTSSFSFVT